MFLRWCGSEQLEQLSSVRLFEVHPRSAFVLHMSIVIQSSLPGRTVGTYDMHPSMNANQLKVASLFLGLCLKSH